MADSTNEIKILISIAKESKEALLGTALDVKTIVTALKGLNAQDLQSIAGQISGLSEAAKNTDVMLETLGHNADGSKKHLFSLAETAEKLKKSFEFLTGGFLGYEAVRMVKDVADLAARAEVLGTVLDVVGKNAGYTSDQLQEVDKKVQSMGITTIASREALVKYIQANFDLAKAATLARAAQDLAVISGEDSSTTFQRLVNAVQTLSTEELRYMGIVLTNDEAQRRYAESHGKVASALTMREKQQALLNAVLEQARTREGAYEQAMGNVGKLLTSLPRFIDNLKEALGRGLLPAYQALIVRLELFLDRMTDTAEGANALSGVAKDLGKAVGTLADMFFSSVEFIVQHREAVYTLIAAYVAMKATISGIDLAKALTKGWELAGNSIITGLATIIGKLETLGTMLGGTGTGALALGASFIALAAALAWAMAGSGKFADILRGIIGGVFAPLIAVIQLVIGAFKQLYDVVSSIANNWRHPFDGLVTGLKQAGEEAKKTAKLIRDIPTTVGNLIFHPGNNGKSPGEVSGDKKGQTEAEQAKELEGQKRVTDLITELGGLKGKEQDAKQEFHELQDARREKRHVDNDVYNAAEKKYTDLHNEVGKVAKELDTALEEATKHGQKLTEQEKQAAKDDAETHKQIYQKQLLVQDLSQAHTELNPGQIDEKGNLVTAEFGTKIGKWQEFLEAAAPNLNGLTEKEKQEKLENTKEFRDAHSISFLKETLNDVMKSASDKGDVDRFHEVVDRLAKAVDKFPELAPLLQPAKYALSVAEVEVRKQREQRDSIARSDTRARIDASFTRSTSTLQTEVDISKAQREQKEKEDQQAYDKGLISLDEYHTRRKQRIVAESIDELRLSSQRQEKLRRELGTAVGVERLQIEAQIQEEKDKRREISERRQIQLNEEDIAQNKTLFDLGIKTIQLRDQTNSALFGEESHQQEIVDKYKEQLRSLHAMVGEGEEFSRIQQEINRAMDQELFKSRLLLIEERTKTDIEKSKAEADYYRSRVETYITHQQYTPQEQINVKNALLEFDKAPIIQELYQVDQKAKETRKEIERITLTEGEDKVPVELLNSLSELETKTMSLQTELIKLGDQFQTYGNQLQRNFTDNVAKGISDLLTGAQSAQKAFSSIFTDFGKFAISKWSENFASNMVEKFVERTRKVTYAGDKDANGNLIPGTERYESPFDSLGKLLGMDKKKRTGSSPADALYTYLINPLPANTSFSQKDKLDTKTKESDRESSSNTVIKPLSPQEKDQKEHLGLSKSNPIYAHIVNLDEDKQDKGTNNAPERGTSNSPSSTEIYTSKVAESLAKTESNTAKIANRTSKTQTESNNSVTTKNVAGSSATSENNTTNNSNPSIVSDVSTLIQQFKHEQHSEGAPDQVDVSGIGGPTSLSDTLSGISYAQVLRQGTSVLQSAVETIKESVSTLSKLAVDNPVTSTLAGGALGGGIGELIGRLSYGKHNKLAREISEEENSAKGAQIGRTIGAVIGIGHEVYDNHKASEAMKGNPLGTLSSVLTGLHPEANLPGATGSGTQSAKNDKKWENEMGTFFADLKGGFGGLFSSIGKLFSGGGSSGGGGGVFGSLLSTIGSIPGLHLAEGGPVSGPGTGTSDSIPAMLSHGEFVVNAESTSKFYPLLHAINSKSTHLQSIAMPGRPSIPKFAAGGIVTQPPSVTNGTALPESLTINAHPDLLKMSFQDVLHQFLATQYALR